MTERFFRPPKFVTLKEVLSIEISNKLEFFFYIKDFYFTLPAVIGNGMTLSRNRIERRNGINDEEPADLRSSTWRTKHIGLEGIRGLTRLLCIFPGYLTVPFFAQVYMVTSKLSVNYLKFSFKSILIKCTIRLRPKIALLRL